MLAEFRAFLTKTNALALAIGVIIGVALGAVVNSLVNDIIMPPIGMALGRVDFSQLKLVLQQGVGTDPKAPGYVAEVAIRYGNFINVLIAFVIIAFVVFWISRTFIREAPAAPGPAMKTCPYCGEQILEQATRCRYCTSELVREPVLA